MLLSSTTKTNPFPRANNGQVEQYLFSLHYFKCFIVGKSTGNTSVAENAVDKFTLLPFMIFTLLTS